MANRIVDVVHFRLTWLTKLLKKFLINIIKNYISILNNKKKPRQIKKTNNKFHYSNLKKINLKKFLPLSWRPNTSPTMHGGLSHGHTQKKHHLEPTSGITITKSQILVKSKPRFTHQPQRMSTIIPKFFFFSFLPLSLIGVQHHLFSFPLFYRQPNREN